MIIVILRCLLLLVCSIGAVALKPLAPPSLSGSGVVLLNLILGLTLGGLGLALEWQMRQAPFRLLVGGVVGLVGGAAVAQVLMRSFPSGMVLPGWPVAPDLIRPILHVLLAVVGMMIGAHKGASFRADRFIAMFRGAEDRHVYKILDTSVIIDGRIADICDTGFVDGTLVIPQFVLRELQYVADSADSLKRNRGRKGLDILQRIKKNSGLNVLISEIDFPDVREVDQKLIELARQMRATIVTNDFNLNKVAQVHGLEVLNINDLANALKPVVLPGETMTVYILKEGKESNQGVAYLDDGTMVVVDNARRQIGRTVDIVVTSVLQTTAGKMFFGRCASDLEKAQARRAGRHSEGREPADSDDKAGQDAG
ncbi:MAG TPA: TRAM domain-containing protein [Candidatus Polarisedimenticolia bacterium]|nr:TRAM domain-containing protein [Candidatus Polarisedimenticolia bacterium]